MGFLLPPERPHWYHRYADFPKNIEKYDEIETWKGRIICNAIRAFEKENPGKPYEVKQNAHFHDGKHIFTVTVTEVLFKNNR